MKTLISLLIISTLSFYARAQERPQWASKTPHDTKSTLFFVGRSPPVDNEAEGLPYATKDAREQLIRQAFGTETKLDVKQHETLHDVSLNSNLEEVSELLRLTGFKQLEVYSEMADGKVYVWTLSSVPKSEVASEKRRIATIQVKKDANIVIPTIAAQTGHMPSKIMVGMRKSEVVRIFGIPYTANSSTFSYNSGKVCVEYSICMVNFDAMGKVSSWSSIRPGRSTDIDDVPAQAHELTVADLPPTQKYKNYDVQGGWTENHFWTATFSCAIAYSTLEPFSLYANKKNLALLACTHFMLEASRGITYQDFQLAVQSKPTKREFYKITQVEAFFEDASHYLEPFAITGTPKTIHFIGENHLVTHAMRVYDKALNANVIIEKKDFDRLTKAAPNRFLEATGSGPKSFTAAN